MYSVKLADGTELKNLRLNGNNFISDTPIGSEVFKDNLEEVIITDDQGNAEKITNAKVIFAKVLGEQSFVLVEKTKEEIEKEKILGLIADLTETVLLGGM